MYQERIMKITCGCLFLLSIGLSSLVKAESANATSGTYILQIGEGLSVTQDTWSGPGIVVGKTHRLCHSGKTPSVMGFIREVNMDGPDTSLMRVSFRIWIAPGVGGYNIVAKGFAQRHGSGNGGIAFDYIVYCGPQ